MKRFWPLLVLASLIPSIACSRPETSPSQSQGSVNPKMTGEVKLARPVAIPSGTTQSVPLQIAKIDESKGVVASASGGCTASGAAEKITSGDYKVSVTIPSAPQDGACSVLLTSIADNTAGAVNLPYLADPEYWKKNAPAMYSFANSKIWTFHSGDDVKVFRLLEASPSSGNKLAVLLVGDGNSRAGMSLTPDNSIVGEFDSCVVEGKFSGTTATMKPMMPSDSCKGITTVTLMVSN